MSAHSRRKGASFERQIATALRDLTGVKFQRNLEQYRAANHGDLDPSDPAWPFALELKAYASGSGCRPAWKDQATKAAEAVNRIPCVIYKFDRVPVRCAVPMTAMCAAFGGTDNSGEWVEVTLDGLAYLASEIMAGAHK
jgi:hypothetical protein